MAADIEVDSGKQYVLGRGALFFAPFLPGTQTKAGGRRYIGNTSAFTLSQALDALDHFDSDNGFKVKDDSITLSAALTGSLTTDNIASKNVGLWFLGPAAQTVIAAGVAETQTITAGHDQYYQLGESDLLPQGFGNVANVKVGTVAAPNTAIAAAGNWEINQATGMFHILPNAPGLTEGTQYVVTFDAVGATDTTVISSGTPNFGELFFQGRNPKGPVRDVIIPWVKLTPSGDYNFKGDDWQAMTLAVEALKLPNRERAYISKRS